MARDEDIRRYAARYADYDDEIDGLVESVKQRIEWRRERAERPIKVCSKCRERKPALAFGENASRPDGLQAECRACRSTV